MSGGRVLSSRIGSARTRNSSRPQRSVSAVVLDADQRQNLVAIRALGEAGINVGALDSRPGVPAYSSRWCSVSGVVPDFRQDTNAYAEAVIDWAERHSGRALICGTDGAIAALRAHRADVERFAHPGLASEDALEIAVSKQRTLALAGDIGVAIPRTVELVEGDDVASAADAVGFPLVVKPFESWVQQNPGGVRLSSKVVVSRDEAARAAEAVWSVGGSAMVQEWLRGTREAVSVFRVNGRVRARFAQVATRMYPPIGGSSVMRASIELPPDITSAAESLVEFSDLDGYAEVEFRRDSHGRPRLMEINPRLSASVELAVRAGVNFPLLLYSWSIGEHVPAVNGYRTGLRMRWLGGDLRWLRSTLARQGRPEIEPAPQALRHFLADFARPARYDYLQVDDLRPAIIASASFLRRMSSLSLVSLARHRSRFRGQ